ncbi:magnesium chelatase [Methanosarcinales archaeon ex4572_44]|nr:MAG: magnesium chelatase [Methanosarcinales archaeon ex4572_44]HHI30595.1 putative cobaltochelatase [Candidatus Methanoperedenaceae archaeon]
MTCFERSVYTFSAIVGQERMKRALILNVIDPKLGGALIKGEKGTAKSTAVRALAHLLPEIDVVKDCPFGCNPEDRHEICSSCVSLIAEGEELEVVRRPMKVVDLPINATEDRVVGTLDIEHVIKEGEKRFEPGVLAEAHRGILYVDEVNLLDDHIVDILLDAAAMGVNIVEREGVSFSHPAHFILVGTMNPEEGELRPQLLDRFGLCAEIEGIKDLRDRVEVIKRRKSFEEDPVAFESLWERDDEIIRDRILRAKELLSEISVPDDMLELIASLCIDCGVDGHRADITLAKAASAFAAYEGRREVLEDDVREVAELVLTHRMRKKPFEQGKIDQDMINDSIERHKKDKEDLKDEKDEGERSEDNGGEGDEKKEEDRESEGGDELFPVGDTFRVKPISSERDRITRDGSGRRTKTFSRRGRYVRSRIPRGDVMGTDVAFDATIRAACGNPRRDRNNGERAVTLHPSDIREKVRERKIGNTILFVVDASGSMGVKERMVAAKGAILSLLKDAYIRRDRVGLVTFRNDRADLLLTPTSSVELAEKLLVELPTGGKTPLSHGILKGHELLKHELLKNTNTSPLMVLISDGRANVSISGKNPIEETKELATSIVDDKIGTVLIDTTEGLLDLGTARELADAFKARYFKLDEINADTIASSIRNVCS